MIYIKKGRIEFELGCGLMKQSDKNSIRNISSMRGVDLISNLEKGNIPFENNSVEGVILSHCLEYIPNYIPLINEIWRILKPDGKFLVKVSNYPPKEGNIVSPFVKKFDRKSFHFFDESKILYRERGWYLSPARFKIQKVVGDDKEISYDMVAKKKKILLVAPRNSIHTNRWKIYLNSTSHHISLASRLQGKNVDFLLGDPTQEKGFQIDNMPLSLEKILEEQSFDVVHAHYSTRYGHVLKSVPNKIRKILSVWGEDVLEEAQSDKECKRRLIIGLENANFVTTTSKHMKKTLIERYGINEKNIWVIPWGYTEKFFQKDFTPYKKRLMELGIPSEGHIFLSGRVCRPQNNIEQLIEGYCKSEVGGLLVVLTGDLQNEEYKKKLEKSVKNNKNILFLPLLSEEDLSLVYNRSDVTLSLPYVDQLSTTVLESLACGTPIICSKIPVYTERIKQGINGQYVDPDNISEISEAIKIASCSKQKMQNAAIDSVKDDSWNANSKDILKVYDIPLDI